MRHHGIEIDGKTEEALKRILDYLEFDERDHYAACQPAERANHIYQSVETVRGWLNGL